MNMSGEQSGWSSGRSGLSSFEVGNCGYKITIENGWRVLDVGSGQAPHSRADVLLEKFVVDDRHRAGRAADASDSRLIVGDALAMPFDDQSFDYSIASHVAEHVDDPRLLCMELMRVSRSGYIETPGWLADVLLREEFHIWRVRRRPNGLQFVWVAGTRQIPIVGEAFYALLYANTKRDGHHTFRPRNAIARKFGTIASRSLGRAIRLPWVRSLFYVTFEWQGSFEVEVSGGHP